MKRLKILISAFLFTFSVHGQNGPFKGLWDIDSCKFDSPCKWVRLSDSLHTLWQIGKPLKSFFDTAYSAPFALMTDTLNPYPKSILTYFDLILPINYGLIISFKHKYQTDTLKDGGYIEVSYDSGRTWNNVIYDRKVHNILDFNMYNMYSESDTLVANNKGFSGTSNGWVYSQLHWLWRKLAKKNLAFPMPLYMRFHFISDSINSHKSGWIIDNIFITQAYIGQDVKGIKKDTKLKYSPNPMTTETVFSFDNSIKEKYTLLLYNSMGQLVKTQSEYHPQSITLKRENLNSGLYYFLLKSESGLQSSGNLMIE